MPYSKLNILIKLSANGVKFISVDRQMLDFLNIITYGTINFQFVEIQNDSMNIKMTLVVVALWSEAISLIKKRYIY